MSGYSVNRMSELLGIDRRTLGKWIGRAGLAPIDAGPCGPVYSLAAVAAVLADADRLPGATADRQDSWRWLQGQHAGAREAVGRLLDALTDTLPDHALRKVREGAAELLRVYGEEVDALIGGAPEPPPPSAGPAWSEMPDAELAKALRAHVNGENEEDLEA